jgi:uncharacterized membrane protein
MRETNRRPPERASLVRGFLIRPDALAPCSLTCRRCDNSKPAAAARAVIPPSLDGGNLAPFVSPDDGDFDDGESSLMTSFARARSWLPGSVFGPGVVGGVATLGAVAAGAAIAEAALIPGLLIGGAAVLAPRLLPRGMLSGLGERLRRMAPSPVGEPSAPTAHSAAAPASGEPEPFDTWRAVVKTVTYRVIVTTADFGANYVVIGELATAAGLSSLSLIAGPIAYFAHEAAWHYYGPAAARQSDPLEATVDVPIPGAAQREDNGRTHFANLKVSRALAKTVTYEGVTGVSEFTVNYLFVRDLAAAAGLTAFSIVIAPFVYYVHEKAWDYYDAVKGRSRAAPAPKLLPAPAQAWFAPGL